MTLFFDARVLRHKTFSGVENYTEHLLKSLKNLLHVTVCKPKTDNRYLQHLWEHLILPFQLENNSLLFSPSNIAPLSVPKKTKLVMTLHDVAYKSYPKSVSKFFYWYYTLIIPINIKRADAIITISEASKQEILKYYPFAKDKITVIPLGIGSKYRVIPSIKKERQILYVGSMNARKNLFGLIEAFEKLPKTLGYTLVVVGNFHQNFSVSPQSRLLFKQAQKNPHIIFKTGLSNEELIEAYNRASLFIFPSFYEGFGLPPLEAMACGTPVIASNLASMPEVCGDAAIYVDPYNSDAMAQKIQEVLSNEALRQKLIEKGLLHAKQFTWEKAAQGHLKLFESVLKS
jgi:glycosyltransferase involved in cell wall biosynthesis